MSDETSNASTVRTSCKNCSFAIYDENTQVGCLQNRINTFGKSVIEAYDNDKQFYVIDRFCNYYRDTAWGYTTEDLKKTERESANSYLLMIDCDDINNKEDTTRFLSNIDYYDDKVTTILFHNHESKKNVQSDVAYIARNCKRIVNISVLSESKQFFLHDTIIKKTNAFFHCLITSVNDDCSLSLQKIEQLINKDLAKAFVINHCGNLYVNNNVYKAIARLNELHTYKDTMERLMTDSKKLNMYTEI